MYFPFKSCVSLEQNIPIVKRGNLVQAAGLLVAAVFLASTTFAADIYVSQSGNGTTNSLAWLNAASNWNGVIIAPGDTIHLVGKFTSQLRIAGSGGTAGNPITILFEPGAKFSKPFWGSGAGCAIYRNSASSYLTIDGGIDGLIENTSNGMFNTYSNDTGGLWLQCASEVEVKNLTVSNLYYRVASKECSASGAGITLSCNNATNVLLHNCKVDMVGNGITLTYGGNNTNIQVYSNTITRISFGIFINTGVVPLRTDAGNTYGMQIWGNRIDRFENWDPMQGPCAGQYHNCGIKWEGAEDVVNNLHSNTNRAMRVHANHIGPSMPIGTAYIVATPNNFQYGFPDCMIYNNLLVEGTNSTSISYAISPQTPGALIANNTLISLHGGGNAFNVQTNTVLLNNNIYNFAGFIFCFTNFVISDYNIWSSPTYNVDGFHPFMIVEGYPQLGQVYLSRNWSWWKNTFYPMDLHSKTNKPVLNLTTYAPLITDTVAVGKGTNLSAYFTTDFTGKPRPATGPWTIGAYEVARSTNSLVPPFLQPVAPR